MTPTEILALYDQQQRRDVEHPAMRREVVPNVVRHVEIAGQDGVVLYTTLTAANADETIREQIAYFTAIGHSFEWKVYSHDEPPDLRDRLAAHGFDCEAVEAIVALDVTNAPAALLQPVAHDVRRVVDPDDLDDVIAIEEQVWGEDREGLRRHLAYELRNTPDQISVYVAAIDGIPASTGWIRFSPGTQFAGLWGGSTLSQYRKHGLYTALLAVRTQEARRRGARFLTVDASPMSRPILEKHGFQFLTYAWACNWRTPNAAQASDTKDA